MSRPEETPRPSSGRTGDSEAPSLARADAEWLSANGVPGRDGFMAPDGLSRPQLTVPKATALMVSAATGFRSVARLGDSHGSGRGNLTSISKVKPGGCLAEVR